MKQNITLSVDVELLREAKLLAAQRNTSVSRLLADELEAKLRKTHEYGQAKLKALALMSDKMDLGGLPLSREQLHER